MDGIYRLHRPPSGATKQGPIDLDYNATTLTAPEAMVAMQSFLHALFPTRRLSRDFLGVRSRMEPGECLGYSPPEISRFLTHQKDEKLDE